MYIVLLIMLTGGSLTGGWGSCPGVFAVGGTCLWGSCLSGSCPRGYFSRWYSS